MKPCGTAVTPDLAKIYCFSGDIEGSIAILQALHQRSALNKGPEDLHTLDIGFDLALAYRAASAKDRSLIAKAIKLLRPVCATREQKLGRDNTATVLAYANLALLLKEENKLSDAKDLIDRLKDAEFVKAASVDFDVLRILLDLGTASTADKKLFCRLREMAAEAIEMGKSKHYFIATLTIFPQLCSVWEELDQWEKAEAWRRKQVNLLVEKKDTTVKNSIPDLAAAQAMLGRNLLYQKKPAQAETFLCDALELQRKSKAQIWAEFKIQYLLGASLLGQKKYDQAEPLLRTGLQGMKKLWTNTSPRMHHADIADCLERLIELFSATDKTKDADHWRKEREVWKAFSK